MRIDKRVINRCGFGGLVSVKLCRGSAAIGLRYFPLLQPMPCRLQQNSFNATRNNAVVILPSQNLRAK